VRVKDAGVVEQNIEVAEPAHRLVDHAAAFFGLSHVGGDENCSSATAEDRVAHLPAAFLITARYGNARTFFGKEDGRGLPDPRGAASDDSDFV
jgi:hypothetical protein